MGSPSRLLQRVLLLLAGSAFIFGSATYVFAAAPQTLGQGPGEATVVTEEVRAWTPESGWYTGVRTRTVTVAETPGGWAVTERLDGATGPRGDQFVVHTDEAYRILTERGALASFPPTVPWGEPRQELQLGVAWDHAGRSAIAAIDTFERTGTDAREGREVLVYEARHTGQFYVVGETAWFRAVARTAYVDAWSGLVVDYTDHETIWRMDLHRELPLRQLRQLVETPEKVWEITVSPTDASVAALADAAKAERSSYMKQTALGSLPLLLAGEVCLFLALVRRRGT